MALPSSGPLSFQQIATELGVNPPLSLASMSQTAGFTPPYAVTNFYGYGGGPNVVTSGLKVYLDAGQTSSYSGSGSAWNDISGNNNNVTLINSPTYSSIDGGSIVFNGASQYGTGTDLDVDYITIQAWVKSTGFGNNGYVVNKNYNGSTVPYSLSLGNTQFGTTNGIGFYSGTWYASLVNTNIMNTNTWYNITGTFDGTTLKYYVNGVLNSSSTPAVNILPKNDNPFTIGAYLNDNAYFIGNISNVLMYNRALNDAEIVQNYNAFATRFGYTPIPIQDGLVLYLDAGNASSYSGSGANWYDLSPSGNNVTLFNSPAYSSSNGGYLQFNGSSQYGNIASSTLLPSGNEASVCIWTYGQVTKLSTIFNAYNGTNRTINLHLPWSDGNVYWDCGSSGATFDRIYINENPAFLGWHYWAFTKNASTGIMEMYKDNILQQSGIGKTLTIPTATIAAIGRDAKDLVNYFQGYIAQVQVYNKSLSSSDISTNFNADKARYGL
jgi:hypothetical protein